MLSVTHTVTVLLHTKTSVKNMDEAAPVWHIMIIAATKRNREANQQPKTHQKHILLFPARMSYIILVI